MENRKPPQVSPGCESDRIRGPHPWRHGSSPSNYEHPQDCPANKLEAQQQQPDPKQKPAPTDRAGRDENGRGNRRGNCQEYQVS
jgi:hypothetical protein